MAYAPLSELPNLYNTKMSMIGNAFGNTNTGLIGRLNNAFGFGNQTGGSSLGVRANAPGTGTNSNTIPVPYANAGRNLGSSLGGGNQSTSGGTSGNNVNVNTSTTPPAPPRPDDASNRYNTATGQLNTNYYGYTPPPTPTPNGSTIPYTANSDLYGQLVTGLANQGNSQNNQNVQAAQQGLLNVSQQNLGNSGQAYQDYQKSIDELNALKSQFAGQTAGIANQPISAQFQQGHQQALQAQNASLLDAAQQRVNEKASALGYGIQGQQAQQSGFNSAGSLGNTAQGLSQSALNSAAGFAAPILTAPGQVPFNPATGTEGSITGSQNGGNGLLISGNLQQLPRLQAQYTDMQNNIGSIQGIEGLLSQTLGGNQNTSDINVFNQAVNHLKANTSDPKYAQFRTLLSSLGQLYSGYFSGSGQETDTTRQIGQSLIDGTASNDTIRSVLNTLKNEAGVRMNTLHQQIQNISQNPSYLGSPNVSGQSNTSSSTSGGSGFGWHPSS